MKAPKKIRGQPADPPPGELARLKAVWRGLDEDARAYWQDLFASKTASAKIRQQLLARLGINLCYNAQLDAFRDWELKQRVLDQHGEWMREIELRLMALHPDWTLDQLREAVLRQAYFVTLASGNFKLGLQAIAQHLNAKKVALGETKTEEAMKDEQAKALEFCLDSAGDFPAVMELLHQAFLALKAAKAGDKLSPPRDGDSLSPIPNPPANG